MVVGVGSVMIARKQSGPLAVGTTEEKRRSAYYSSQAKLEFLDT